MARGFLQRQGIDFTEVFAPVARLETIRIVVAIACAKRWSLIQLDVKSTFLHGPLEEEVYVQQPSRFNIRNKEQQVYKFIKLSMACGKLQGHGTGESMVSFLIMGLNVVLWSMRCT